MHVLVLPSWYPIKEAPLQGVYFVEQMQAVARRGVQFGVVYPERRSPRALSWQTLRRNWFQKRYYEERGLPTFRGHSWNVLWKLPGALSLRIREAHALADRYIERFGRPDLIHAHSTQWAGAAAARINRAYGLPYVVSEHFSGFQRESLTPWQRKLAREGFQHAEAVAAVSTPLKRLLVRRQLVAPERARVLPNFVDEHFFSLPPRGRPRSSFRFFALGRLVPRKGVDVLIEAFARAFSEEPGVLLEIGGTGPEQERLTQLARELDVSDRVTFLGALNREAVRDALWRAHAFAHASFHETFGIVLAEAMATGQPVVATRSGGPEDLVMPATGRLVPTHDAEALAAGMRALHDDYSQYDARRIRQHAVENFGVDIFVERALSLYRSALASYRQQK